MHTKALTLLEIIISVVIFALVVMGLANVFVVGKRYVVHSRCRVTAAEFGKRCLDPLWQHIREDEWPTTFNSSSFPVSYTFAGITYTSNAFASTDVSSGIKRVTTTINWTEN